MLWRRVCGLDRQLCSPQQLSPSPSPSVQHRSARIAWYLLHHCCIQLPNMPYNNTPIAPPTEATGQVSMPCEFLFFFFFFFFFFSPPQSTAHPLHHAALPSPRLCTSSTSIRSRRPMSPVLPRAPAPPRIDSDALQWPASRKSSQGRSASHGMLSERLLRHRSRRRDVCPVPC